MLFCRWSWLWFWFFWLYVLWSIYLSRVRFFLYFLILIKVFLNILQFYYWRFWLFLKLWKIGRRSNNLFFWLVSRLTNRDISPLLLHRSWTFRSRRNLASLISLSIEILYANTFFLYRLFFFWSIYHNSMSCKIIVIRNFLFFFCWLCWSICLMRKSKSRQKTSTKSDFISF